MDRRNMSVARVEKLSASNVGKAERHNERKNENYDNINVETERIPFNVCFKSTGGLTYNEYFDKLIEEGKISTRGLKDDATLFNEMIIDVNTEYFEEHGGYDFAKKFFGEAYLFCCNLYGKDNIVSAVMHADEINKEVSERLGKSVYHYHLHVVAIPTVDKEIRWSARCKDENLRGTVKEVIRQVSHSKKWKNTVPMLDDKGKPVVSKTGKPVLIKSYSILQDELFQHMKQAGFRDFERGERGSTAEHLTSLEYQIQQDKERLGEIKEQVSDTKQKLADVQIKYKEESTVARTYMEIEYAGKKGLTGKYTLSKEDYTDLTKLAKQGLSARGEIISLQDAVEEEKRRSSRISSSLYEMNKQYDNLRERFNTLCEKYNSLLDRFNKLWEVCEPYLEALKRFPRAVKDFIEKLIPPKHKEQETQSAEPTRTVRQKDDEDLDR